ncbi:hypothetical protein Trydic_g14554 [Trypoxylus dichotomus]
MEEFLNKLNRGFFEKTLASENPALKIAITHKTCGVTKHRTVKEEEARESRENFEVTRVLRDAPSKFQEGRRWKKMDRRREFSQPTATEAPLVRQPANRQHRPEDGAMFGETLTYTNSRSRPTSPGNTYILPV